MIPDPDQYVCIHKLNGKPLDQCYRCTGITNMCGMYSPLSGTDPFEDKYRDRKTVEEILKEVKP